MEPVKQLESSSVDEQLKDLARMADVLSHGLDSPDLEKNWTKISSNWEKLKLESEPLSSVKERFSRSKERIQAVLKKRNFHKSQEDKLKSLEEMSEKLKELGKAGVNFSKKQSFSWFCQKTLSEMGDIKPEKTAKLKKAFEADLRKFIDDLKDERWGNDLAKDQLLERAKDILARGDINKSRNNLEDLRTQWKKTGYAVGKKKATWDEFQGVLENIHKKSVESEKANDLERDKLILRARELQDSEEWKKTTEEMKTLQKTWKELGPSSPKKMRRLYLKFQSACQKFFNQRKIHFDERDEENAKILEKKEFLLKKIEKVDEIKDLTHALEELKKLELQWRDLGMLPRKYSRILTSYRQACDKIYEKKNALRQADREAIQEKVSQKEELLREFDKTLEEGKLSEIQKVSLAIHKKWEEIGATARGKDAQLEKRLDKCQVKMADVGKRLKADKKKEQLKVAWSKYILILESLTELRAGGKDVLEEGLLNLDKKWKDLPSTTLEKELKKGLGRVSKALKDLDSSKWDFAKGFDKNEKEKEYLCFKMEHLAGIESEANPKLSQKLFIEELASKMGQSNSSKDPLDEAVKILVRWLEVGPVDVEKENKFCTKFEKAFFSLAGFSA